MNESKLFIVKEVFHSRGFGWRAKLDYAETLGPLTPHETRGLDITFPYDHPLFGDAAAYLVKGKNVRLTYGPPIHTEVTEEKRIYLRGDALFSIKIEPCFERMHHEEKELETRSNDAAVVRDDFSYAALPSLKTSEW